MFALQCLQQEHWESKVISLGLVVQMMDIAINQMNHYQVDIKVLEGKPVAVFYTE